MNLFFSIASEDSSSHRSLAMMRIALIPVQNKRKLQQYFLKAIGTTLLFATSIFALALSTPASASGRAAPGLRDGEYYGVFNGVKHWYRITGAKNHTVPLIIVHGGPGGNTYSFEHQIGPSIERFETVVYYDQRGSGRSDAPRDDRAYGIDILVSDLDALRRQLGAGQIDLLGFSFGGELALEFALAHPDRVRRLIAQSASNGDWCRISAYQARGFAAQASGERRIALNKLANTPCADDPAAREDSVWKDVTPGQVDHFLFHDASKALAMHRLDRRAPGNSGKMAAVVMRESAIRPDLLSRIGQIRAKTLVMVGAYDRNVGVDLDREIAESIPHSHFVIFAKSGHFPYFEEPTTYAAVVHNFLGSSPKSDGISS